MEFFDWSILSTFAGAVLAVAILTQMTKSIPGVNKIPTQLWSYLLGLVVLLAAHAFTDGLSASVAVLALFNAALVSLAANGGYAAIQRVKDGLSGPEAE